MLSLPCIGPGSSREAHDQIASVVEINRCNLCLFHGDALFCLVHFHNVYDHHAIFPMDSPVYGHLLPRGWMQSMLQLNGNMEEADTPTDDQLALSDYQWCSPHTAINILCTSQITAAAGINIIVNLELEDGKKVRASGISTYSRNAIHLARVGRDALEDALQKEVAMTWSQ